MATVAQLPVYTSEVNARFNLLARIRLRSIPGIKFFLGDSREFLSRLPGLLKDQSKRVLFYLDAHWYADLPLEGELEIIAKDWQMFVIMIDDFQVPGDDGYGYDSYDEHQTLTFERFAGVFRRHCLMPFFPSLPSQEETGIRRGCVVLAREAGMVESLAHIPSLCRKEVPLAQQP